MIRRLYDPDDLRRQTGEVSAYVREQTRKRLTEDLYGNLAVFDFITYVGLQLLRDTDAYQQTLVLSGAVADRHELPDETRFDFSWPTGFHDRRIQLLPTTDALCAVHEATQNRLTNALDEWAKTFDDLPPCAYEVCGVIGDERASVIGFRRVKATSCGVDEYSRADGRVARRPQPLPPDATSIIDVLREGSFADVINPTSERH